MSGWVRALERRADCESVTLQTGPGLPLVHVDGTRVPSARGRYRHLKFVGWAKAAYGLCRKEPGVNLQVHEFFKENRDVWEELPQYLRTDFPYYQSYNLSIADSYVRLTQNDVPDAKYSPQYSAKSHSDKLGLRALKLPVPARREALTYPCPNENANPGPSWCAKGFSKKGDCWRAVQTCAYKMVCLIGKGKCTFDSIMYGVGGRARQWVSTVTEKRPPARVILIPDSQENIIGGMLVKPLMEAIKRVCPNIVIGHSWQNLGTRRLHNLLNQPDFVQWWCLDFSSFDYRVYSWAVSVAFDIVERSFLAKTTGEKKRLKGMIAWCKAAYLGGFIITPWGDVYRRQHGTPSGSVWTTLINSLVNYIYLTECMRVLGVSRAKYEVFVLGDDSVVCLRADALTRRCSFDRFVTVLTKKFKLRVNPSSYFTNNFFSSTHVLPTDTERFHDGVSFLGRCWSGPDTAFRTLYDSIMDMGYPSARPKGNLMSTVMVAGLYADNPFHPTFESIARRFAEWALDQRIPFPGTDIPRRRFLGTIDRIGFSFNKLSVLYLTDSRMSSTVLSHFKPSRGEVVFSSAGYSTKVRLDRLAVADVPQVMQALVGDTSKLDYVPLSQGLTTVKDPAVARSYARRQRRLSEEALEVEADAELTRSLEVRGHPQGLGQRVRRAIRTFADVVGRAGHR